MQSVVNDIENFRKFSQSTTGPPRIPPSQGCKHLSVMPLFQKCNVSKKDNKILVRMRQIFIEFQLVCSSREFHTKR